jgi:hypothetical protein
MTVSLYTQGIGVSFLDKYGKDEGIEVVTIGKKMLDLILSDSIASPELQEAIVGLESIQIISSKDTSVNKNYYDAAFNLLAKSKDFVELLSLHDKNENMVVMIKETKGVVSELVLLSNTPGRFDLITLRGHIQLDMIAKYSQHIDMNELKKLNFLENKNKK